MAHYREFLPRNHPDQSTFVEIIREYDGKDVKTILRTIEDEQAVADECARLRQHAQYGSKVGGARQVALTPRSRFSRWKRDYRKFGWDQFMTWQQFKDWKLEQPENRAFRVHESTNRVPIAERLAGIRARSA